MRAFRLCALTLLVLSSSLVHAVVSNFSTDFSGDLLFLPIGRDIGDPVGKFRGTLHYNLGDATNRVTGTPGADGFPDKMAVALDPPGADPASSANAATYSPFPAFQAEYFVDLHLSLTQGSIIGESDWVFEIQAIQLTNDVLLDAPSCRDKLVVSAGDLVLDFASVGQCTSFGGAGAPMLDDILLENALLNLPATLTPQGLFGEDFLVLLGLMPSSGLHIGGYDFIGPLTAEAAAPTVFALLLLPLLALASWERGFLGLGSRPLT